MLCEVRLVCRASNGRTPTEARAAATSW
eukprot:COSAG04_NODE_23433_length_338_cov_1.075314_1_plen_27_part_10